MLAVQLSSTDKMACGSSRLDITNFTLGSSHARLCFYPLVQPALHPGPAGKRVDLMAREKAKVHEASMGCESVSSKALHGILGRAGGIVQQDFHQVTL